MPQAVKLAIIGYGLVGRRHATAIAQTRSAELVAVVESSETARQEAEALGTTVFPDLESFFARSRADGAIVATPNALHVEQALACIAEGCPVLVEKPIATNSSDARKLVAEAKARRVPLLVGHHRRHNPIIQTAKEVIESGQIGQVRAVQATCWFYKPDSYFDEADWRKQAGAGPVAINLVHDIDLIRHLCGEVRSVRAAACPSLRGYHNEDVAGALMEFVNGAIGTVSVSDSVVAPWSWELTSREYPIYPPTSESCYQIGGSHGSLSVPDLRLWSYGSTRRDWWAPISATALQRTTTDPLVNQIAHFADVIHGAARPLVSGHEGLRTLKVIEAMQRSAATGQDVRLDASPQEGVAAAG